MHWNNLAPQPEYSIASPEGVELNPAAATFPEVEQEADADPREFLVEINADRPPGEGEEPLELTVTYYACDNDNTWCIPVTQSYEISLVADPDGGRAFGRGAGGRFGGGRGMPGGPGGMPGGGQGRPDRNMMRERIRSWDTNADGLIVRDEVPEPMRERFFDRADTNGDGVIDAEEARFDARAHAARAAALAGRHTSTTAALSFSPPPWDMVRLPLRQLGVVKGVMHRRVAVLAIAAVLCGVAPNAARVQDGGDGATGVPSQQRLRYVNPLVMENAGRLADPTVIRFRAKYYLYLTGGVSPGGSLGAAVWSSEDLVSWKHHLVSIPEGRGISAPTAFAYEGYVYLTGNDSGLFRSRDPLGPFEFFGDFVDEHGHRLEGDLHAACGGCEDGGVFDPAVFVDDDDRVYLYYAGGGTDGVYGVELDRTDLRRFAGPYEHFFRFEPAHVWERYGSRNEMSAESWIEGPWMTKHNGTYYLQYAAPGTDWITYGVGVYTSDKPLGPVQLLRGQPDPRSSRRTDQRLRSPQRRRGPRRKPVGDLYAAVPKLEPYVRAPYRHGSRRLRRAGQHVHQRPIRGPTVGAGSQGQALGGQR